MFLTKAEQRELGKKEEKKAAESPYSFLTDIKDVSYGYVKITETCWYPFRKMEGGRESPTMTLEPFLYQRALGTNSLHLRNRYTISVRHLAISHASFTVLGGWFLYRLESTHSWHKFSFRQKIKQNHYDTVSKARMLWNFSELIYCGQILFFQKGSAAFIFNVWFFEELIFSSLSSKFFEVDYLLAGETLN